MAHVLLIDDDVDLVATNKLALENGGHTVSAAYSAKEGFEAVERLRPELIVLDVMMESFYAGFELAQRLNREYPKLPMIMLSGVDECMDDAVRASQDHDDVWMPVHRFMEKPVPGAVLLYEVDHLLHEAL